MIFNNKWQDVVSTIVCAAYLLLICIYQGFYPDMTHMRIFVNLFWYFITMFIVVIIMAIWKRMGNKND